eukprot:TRINITY_DN4854_c0_g1_i3.p1 TRINITY_DN4854_c0_g1~~TRINITY_DN4854_c0_g1_i3.p1  ORF type:complete len:366 (+),score=56.46 TRINITY_DN4854_c0_g1_i3:644-1741(+)
MATTGSKRMATFKVYGACQVEEDACQCKCQGFDVLESDSKLCDACCHKKGFHTPQTFPIAMQAMADQKSYGKCLTCKCQEYDDTGTNPRVCDVCSHHRSFHSAIIPFMADADPHPVFQIPGGEHVGKRMKIESQELSSDSFMKEPMHESDSLVQGPTPTHSATVAAADDYGNAAEKSTVRPKGAFVSQLEFLLRKRKDVTENAGISLVFVNSKWRVECCACKTTISVGPGISLGNFEEHVGTARHKKNYDVHVGAIAEEAEQQSTRSEARRLAGEESAKMWMAAHADEGIEFADEACWELGWKCVWCNKAPATFSNGEGNILSHLKGKDHQRKSGLRLQEAGKGSQPGGTSVLQMLHGSASMSRK